MFGYVRFFINKLFSSKYIVTGKCRQCGNCCRNILFYVGKNVVTEEEQFERMKEFDKKYNNFYISGKGEKGELLFACKSLTQEGKCSVYRFRSLHCRFYPVISQKFVYNGGQTLDGCGYKFEVNKKFKDYIN